MTELREMIEFVGGAIEARIRLRMVALVADLRDATAKHDGAVLDSERAEEIVEALVDRCMTQYRRMGKLLAHALLPLVCDSLVASLVDSDDSLLIAHPDAAGAYRLRQPQPTVVSESTEARLVRIIQLVRGVKRGGSRTAPGWRYKGYVQFAEEVERTLPLLSEAIQRRRRGADFASLTYKITDDRSLRQLVASDIRNRSHEGSRDLAILHAARSCGLKVKTLSALRRYYEKGADLEREDRIAGVLDLIEPVELEVKLSERRWPNKSSRLSCVPQRVTEDKG